MAEKEARFLVEDKNGVLGWIKQSQIGAFVDAQTKPETEEQRKNKERIRSELMSRFLAAKKQIEDGKTPGEPENTAEKNNTTKNNGG